MSYADYEDLTAYLADSPYTLPAADEAARLLERASALIQYATFGRASDPTSAQETALVQANCEQVEFWLEVGEEHDVAGLRGSLQGGRVQIQKLPGALGQRAIRTLIGAGLLWQAAAVR
jgi:hypothetical protein